MTDQRILFGDFAFLRIRGVDYLLDVKSLLPIIRSSKSRAIAFEQNGCYSLNKFSE